MPLPVIQQPIYEVYLKSLDKKVRFRPFLVKEEKLFLMSKETDEELAIVNSIKQVINNCCLDEVDLDALPTFDIEMFFINLRMRSVGEKVKLSFTCKEKNAEGEPCNFVNNYELDLEKVQYLESNNHSRDIKLTDTVGVKMNYPVLTNIESLLSSENVFENSIKLISENVQYVYDENQVYDRSVFNGEELENFLESLTTDNINQILKFFVDAPKVVIKDNASCNKCGHEHKIYAENLYSFFI